VSARLQHARSTKDGPWCWQIKAALKLIGEIFSESNQLASARSLYLALTQLASDHGSETFTESKALIAHKAGLSISTVNRLLKAFEELRLIRIERSMRQPSSGYIKAPNTYTLLSIGNDYLSSIGNGRKHVSVTDKVKKKKEIEKENTPKGVHHVIPTSGTTLRPFCRNGRGEDKLSLYSDEERQMIDLYNTFCDIMEGRGERWSRVNKYTDTVAEALEMHSDTEEFRKFLNSALDGNCSIPNRHTLVRLCWDNY
jgi:hypothetical protein